MSEVRALLAGLDMVHDALGVGAAMPPEPRVESERRSMITDGEVIQAMQTHGGGFVKRLAELAKVADSVNLARIKAAFPVYWSNYGLFAEKMKGKET